MNAGAKGVKIMCSGRLAGSEIARKETQKMGSIPLQTLDANVDYGTATSRTTYGAIGIKVWIYKGKFGEEIVAKAPQRRRRAVGFGDERGGGSRYERPAPAPQEGQPEVKTEESKPAEEKTGSQ